MLSSRQELGLLLSLCFTSRWLARTCTRDIAGSVDTASRHEPRVTCHVSTHVCHESDLAWVRVRLGGGGGRVPLRLLGVLVEVVHLAGGAARALLPSCGDLGHPERSRISGICW